MGCTNSTAAGARSDHPARPSQARSLAAQKPHGTHFSLSDETYASLALCWKTFRECGPDQDARGNADDGRLTLTERAFVRYACRHKGTRSEEAAEVESAAALFRRIVGQRSKRTGSSNVDGPNITLGEYLLDLDRREVEAMLDRGSHDDKPLSDGKASAKKKKSEAIGLSYIKTALNADGAELLQAIQVAKANPERDAYPRAQAIKIMCAFRDRQSSTSRSHANSSSNNTSSSAIPFGNPFDELALKDLEFLKSRLGQPQPGDTKSGVEG